MKISDFQSKDVINIVDGKKLGQVSDLELDLRQGRIEAIVVPSHSRFFGFFGGNADVIIPWRNIVKIGADVILVRLDERIYRPTEDDVPAEYVRPSRERDREAREREREQRIRES
ncbi:YlmC/YmxH family sporulation protein [Gorillibacterium sp. CAU 1737]|uniref:YlmC/YmxH family sporulation protein n=1 Tax=Gorillibacterium sp. CAU 1737 TaxID=3140362 RepID=UPI00325FF193